jgi:hypothetical protein
MLSGGTVIRTTPSSGDHAVISASVLVPLPAATVAESELKLIDSSNPLIQARNSPPLLLIDDGKNDSTNIEEADFSCIGTGNLSNKTIDPQEAAVICREPSRSTSAEKLNDSAAPHPSPSGNTVAVGLGSMGLTTDKMT